MSFEMEQRLNQVLQLFLSPDYDIASTSYFDLLLSHIAENTSKRKRAKIRIQLETEII